MTNDEGRAHLAELADELYDRCAPVVELDGPQIEGFVSGLFAAWDSEEEALAFVERCRREPSPRSAIICAALAVLDDARIGGEAGSVADEMASSLSEAARSLGRSRVAQAWRVEAPFGRSIVIGFASGIEGVDHAVLAEIGDEALVDLRLAGAPEELLDVESLGDGAIQVYDLEAGQAVEQLGEAWLAAHGRVDPTVGMLANQRLVRARLKGDIADSLPFFAESVDVDRSRGMSASETAEANRAARSTLQAALGAAPDVPVEAAWGEVFFADVAGLSSREREALLWLEWADWLGAALGLARGLEAERELDGELLVDLVNRCPEVSSTIHGDDRDYAAWAFEVALEHLRDAGVVVENRLPDQARAAIYPSFMALWSDHPAAPIVP